MHLAHHLLVARGVGGFAARTVVIVEVRRHVRADHLGLAVVDELLKCDRTLASVSSVVRLVGTEFPHPASGSFLIVAHPIRRLN
jgi:hypothetical protein